MSETDAVERAGRRRNEAQTLARGLELLETLRAAHERMTRMELATAIGVHHTIVYRLLNTLESAGYVTRTDDRRYGLGPALIRLGEAVDFDVRKIAAAHMAALAEELGATVSLSIADGDYAVAAEVVEPQTSKMHVAYRVGVRHRLDEGASGIAILAGRPAQPGEREEIAVARRRGYAETAGELEPGACGVAAPIVVDGMPAEASIGIVTLGDRCAPGWGERVAAVAAEIATRLSSAPESARSFAMARAVGG